MADAHVARDGAIPQHTTCRACGQRKPAFEFYSGHVNANGLAGECKECTKLRVRQRSRSNPEVQAYDRERAKLPHRAELRREITKRWRDQNPTGYAAQSAVSNAIRDGRLTKEPCLFCGAGKVHAHHRDYTKPLEVIWLCPKCHHRLHKNFPETEGRGKQA